MVNVLKRLCKERKKKEKEPRLTVAAHLLHELYEDLAAAKVGHDIAHLYTPLGEAIVHPLQHQLQEKKRKKKKVTREERRSALNAPRSAAPPMCQEKWMLYLARSSAHSALTTAEKGGRGSCDRR